MSLVRTELGARLAEMRPRLIVIFHESWKYFLVSALCLGVDLGLFTLLVAGLHVYYLLANLVSVSTGLVVNYLMSVALVFRERRLASRTAEFIAFFVIGLLGLAVNEGCIAAFVVWMRFAPVPAKILAAGVSFVFNFVVRRAFLFTARE